MTNLDSQLRRLCRLSDVPRWVVVPTIRRQSVAEHTFRVMAIVKWLHQFHAQSDGFLGQALEYALVHDEEESITGDIPGPIKASGVPKIRGLSPTADGIFSPAQLNIVKCADALEALLFLQEEQRMGNSRGLSAVELSIFAVFARHWTKFDWADSFERPWPSPDNFLLLFLETAGLESHPLMDYLGGN